MQEKYINLMIKEAEKAKEKGEVPVGCVIIKDGKVIAKAHNLVETRRNIQYHAEMIAINKASKKIKNWRLNGCEMYVTLEPCDMCSYAIYLSRIDKVYYLLKKTETAKRQNNFVHMKQYEHLSKKIIQDFFKKQRN